MRNSIFIKIQSVPLLEQIEKRDRKGESHLEIRPDSLPQMFQFANLRQQRENRFDQHSVVPLAAPTDFQIFRLIDSAPKAGVRQNNHFPDHSFDERQKLLVGDIRRFNLPVGDESELVGQKAELAADNPFPRSEAFFADALSVRLMNFSNRMTQFDTVRINHAHQRWFSQKLFRYPVMRFQTAKKSGALRQIGEKIDVVLFDPSVKSVLRRAFERKQQSERDKFADGKFGLQMFRRFNEHIVYTTKKFCDKLFLSHGFCFPVYLVSSPIQ